jgi:type IV pilus assembly protein PilM
MSLITGVGDFFGLEIGGSTVRAVQLKGVGASKALATYGAVDVDERILSSDAATDQLQLAGVIKSFLQQVGISSKDVVVNIPTSRVTTTVVDFDKMAARDLVKSIDLQAENYLPMSVNDTKYDWSLLGESPTGPNKVEVLISSVSRAHVESRLDMLESIGLNVLSFEPDAFASLRSLNAREYKGNLLMVNIGAATSDVCIMSNDVPKLVRNIPVGSKAWVKAVSQAMSVDETQAEQFIFKFGLAQDKLDGQIARTLATSIDMIVLEIERSLKYFETRYGMAKVDKVIVSGAASIVPELPAYFANKFGLTVELGNCWRNISFIPARQNELIAVANQFSVATGLALRKE